MDSDAAIGVGERLAARYCAIRAGAMRDMPICNEALEVAAIGFRPFGEWAFGVVVTPWMMSLVGVMPSTVEGGPGPGQTRRVALPAGDVEFVSSELEGFGVILSCSLFSPMFDFPDAETANEAAGHAIDALFDPGFFAPDPHPRAPALDRRAFMRGRLPEANHERA